MDWQLDVITSCDFHICLHVTKFTTKNAHLDGRRFLIAYSITACSSNGNHWQPQHLSFLLDQGLAPCSTFQEDFEAPEVSAST